MRILLVSVNRSREIMPAPPAGLAAITPCIDGQYHDLGIIDLLFESHPIQAASRAAEGFRPDIIGLSIRNVDNQLMARSEFYLEQVRAVISCMKTAAPKAKIIIGGAGFTLMPKEIFRYLDADYGLAGEAELTFPKLIKSIEDGGIPQDLSGLVWKEGGEVRFNPPEFPGDLNTVPSPDWSLIKVDEYNKMGGMGIVVSRRGCPMRCLFCDSPQHEGTVLRPRPPAMVADDIERMYKDSGVKSFFLMDSMLNHPPERAVALANEIASRKIDISWSGTFHPESIDLDTLKIMKSAGCNTMMISPEALSDKMMISLRKDFTVEDTLKAASAMEAAGIKYMVSIMLGAPGESYETMNETFSNLTRFKPVMVSIRAGIRVTPGTGLHSIAIEEGMLSESTPLLMPTFYLSRKLGSLHEVLSKVQEYKQGHGNWLISGVDI